MTQRDDEMPPTLVGGIVPSEGETVPDLPATDDGPAGEDRFADPDLDALESLGRFRIERFLGAGGMGKVFRAFDRKLERPVALKLLTLSDAAAAKRFLAEARAQARVDHPNVCQVFDAGEVRGRRFIVMQLLEGRTLSRVAPDLTLETRIALVRDVCEGVQAAHKIGLVHRDLKASNVLVVETDSGLHPYVVDFGLAREVGIGGATVTAAAAGTPWYMAPEQVTGAAVDRRADIYSLGVLLYRLLADRYPIEGKSEVDVMLRVLTEDPEPLRRVAPQIPSDLETVVMKCLERDPARRYDSARALADELGRWLAGEPISARPAGIGYRLGKKIRKNRTLVALGTAAVIAVIAAGSVAIVERMRAAERTRLAQGLGAETERLEWTLRAAYELPLHDVSAVRRSVRDRLTALEGTVAALGRGLAGPGRFALGRGWLALDEAELADTELSRAWEGGYRVPEVALARGLVFARLFERAIDRARRIANADERSAAYEDARQEFEQPAVEYLALGRGAGGSQASYVEALLAFHDERWEEALVAARAAVLGQPWLYEAKLLEGAIELARADAAEAPAERSARFGAAHAALVEAARRGESDPRAYASLCAFELDRLGISLEGSATDAATSYQSAILACDQALTADPDYAAARLLRLEAITSWSSFAMDVGHAVGESLKAAEVEARALATARPEDAQARVALARVLEIRAKGERYVGDDSRPALEEAIAELEHAAALAPAEWRILRGLGRASAELAVQVTERGGDPLPHFERAIGSLERAIGSRNNLALLHFDLGRARSDRGAFYAERGGASRPDLEAATADYERALALKGDYPQAWNSLGAAHLQLGQETLTRGGDPRPELARATSALERAIEIRPSYANPRFNLGLVHRELATAELVAGREPRAEMARARAAFEAGLAINPGIFFAYLEMSRIDLVGARWELGHGGSPARDLAQARATLARALADAPDDFMALRVAGETDLIEAEWQLRDGRDAAAALARARAQLDRALAANAVDAETLRLLEQSTALTARAAVPRAVPREVPRAVPSAVPQ